MEARLYPAGNVTCDTGREHRARGAPNETEGEKAMIDLYNAKTQQVIGSITDPDLQVLQNALEEESSTDQDYYIDAATIDVIADGQATEHLVGLLRKALGSAEGVDIRWQRR